MLGNISYTPYHIWTLIRKHWLFKYVFKSVQVFQKYCSEVLHKALSVVSCVYELSHLEWNSLVQAHQKWNKILSCSLGTIAANWSASDFFYSLASKIIMTRTNLSQQNVINNDLRRKFKAKIAVICIISNNYINHKVSFLFSLYI